MILTKYNKLLFLSVIILFGFNNKVLAQKTDGTVCRVIANYDNAISAQYNPGIDVHGNRVAVAELGNGPSQYLPEVIRIPINIDLANYTQQQLPAGTQMESNFGMVEIHPDGAVKYNGHDITSTTYTYCGMEAPVIHEAAMKVEEKAEVKAMPAEHCAPQKHAEKTNEVQGEQVATQKPKSILLGSPVMKEPELSEPVLQEPMQVEEKTEAKVVQVNVESAPNKPIILGNPPRRSAKAAEGEDMLYGSEH